MKILSHCTFVGSTVVVYLALGLGDVAAQTSVDDRHGAATAGSTRQPQPLGNFPRIAQAQNNGRGDLGEEDPQAEIKTPLIHILLDLLDGLSEDATKEEQRTLRRVLTDADAELNRSLGRNSLRRIQRANNNYRRASPVNPSGTFLYRGRGLSNQP